MKLILKAHGRIDERHLLLINPNINLDFPNYLGCSIFTNVFDDFDTYEDVPSVLFFGDGDIVPDLKIKMDKDPNRVLKSKFGILDSLRKYDTQYDDITLKNFITTYLVAPFNRLSFWYDKANRPQTIRLSTILKKLFQFYPDEEIRIKLIVCLDFDVDYDQSNSSVIRCIYGNLKNFYTEIVYKIKLGDVLNALTDNPRGWKFPPYISKKFVSMIYIFSNQTFIIRVKRSRQRTLYDYLVQNFGNIPRYTNLEFVLINKFNHLFIQPRTGYRVDTSKLPLKRRRVSDHIRQNYHEVLPKDERRIRSRLFINNEQGYKFRDVIQRIHEHYDNFLEQDHPSILVKMPSQYIHLVGRASAYMELINKEKEKSFFLTVAPEVVCAITRMKDVLRPKGNIDYDKIMLMLKLNPSDFVRKILLYLQCLYVASQKYDPDEFDLEDPDKNPFMECDNLKKFEEDNDLEYEPNLTEQLSFGTALFQSFGRWMQITEQ